MILRMLGWIACWFVIGISLEVLHGVATGLGLLPYPGKGVIGPIDWVLMIISVPLAIALYRALSRRRSRVDEQLLPSFNEQPTPSFNALLAILIGLHFAPPFFWGLNGLPVLAAVLWAVFMAAEAVITGWRAPQHGFIISFLMGSVFASLWCIPTYYLAHVVFLQESLAVGPFKIAAIVLFSYALTGIWILWRGFNESSPIKQPLFVSRFFASRDWSFLIGVGFFGFRQPLVPLYCREPVFRI